MAEYFLYHTEGCHLCHHAEAVLNEAGICYQLVDICDDAEDNDRLAERYGERIPVLQRLSDGAELGWPFDVELVMNFRSLM